MMLELKKIKDELSSVMKRLEALLMAETARFNKVNEIQYPADQDYFPSHNELILKTALREIGVKELSGPPSNPRVEEYHRFASKANNADQKDDVSWCSSFLCWVVEHCYTQDGKPIPSTNSMMARSWLKWGTSSKTNPMPGDIVVYWRESVSSWKGHCGIFLKQNPDGTIVTLGGNQSDEVNISSYSPDKLLDIRRAPGARVYDETDAGVLYTIARGIIAGKYIKDGGKVV